MANDLLTGRGQIGDFLYVDESHQLNLLLGLSLGWSLQTWRLEPLDWLLTALLILPCAISQQVPRQGCLFQDGSSGPEEWLTRGHRLVRHRTPGPGPSVRYPILSISMMFVPD